jgi:hypothetical protein
MLFDIELECDCIKVSCDIKDHVAKSMKFRKDLFAETKRQKGLLTALKYKLKGLIDTETRKKHKRDHAEAAVAKIKNSKKFKEIIGSGKK